MNPIENDHKSTRTEFEIAVIGMAGRFPGAKDVDRFWDSLKNGSESITFFSEEELESLGVESHVLKDPLYIKTNGGLLEDKEYFDAAFFGYTPGEAETMDPQVRLFHECTWTALENAGYNPESYSGLIGLYAGASSNFNWEAFSLLSGKKEILGKFLASQLMDKDYLCAQVSYKLNLKGPAVSMHTTCSTSLVAIHMACQGLLSGECDMALAGGVSVSSGPMQGYLYEEGMIFSSDGHCRPFDAKAGGTVAGEGAGIVVLKSMEDAVDDGDYIHAVIKSSAINNDGSRKVGFAAPSIEGQAEVIRAALHMAEVEPESIGCIEAHGTGTKLGDPIEINALKLAFDTDKKQFCAIGSAKSNVGHLDTAAGVTGLIKIVLALNHRQIPPSLHFETPNPAIDFENSPFYVNTVLKEWKNEKYPLRAGVSSFGIGGTNAHVILEEPPGFGHTHSPVAGGEEESEWRRKHQLILLSARTPSALDTMTKNLHNYLKENLLYPGLTLADAAYTLQKGRKTFKHRKMVVCSTLNEAIDALSSTDAPGARTFTTDPEHRPPVVFMFPGQGAQYVNMGLELYQKEPGFREAMDRCFEILEPLMGNDPKEVLFPPATRNSQLATSPEKINQTEITQPLLFVFEYALASLLMAWGISPDAMIGHSIGEYTAACLAGVFSLEDALTLVAARGELMQQMPPGSMLSLPMSEEELLPLLEGDISLSLSLAALNSPTRCVVSGTGEAVDAFDAEMKARGCETTRLHTSHAFHSPMTDPLLIPFEEKVKTIRLNSPKKPYISNVTGRWVTEKEATDHAYWARHLRAPVRFSDGIKELVKKDNFLFLEVGPGKTLSTLVKQHGSLSPGKEAPLITVNLVRHPKENKEGSDARYVLNKLGELWLYGITPDWSAFYGEEKRYRVPLPTYPFDGRKYPAAGDISRMGRDMMAKSVGPSMTGKPGMADWFYVPVWEQSPVSRDINAGKQTPFQWLVFAENSRFSTRLIDQLECSGHDVITVTVGPGFNRVSEKKYTLHPQQEDDYIALFKALSRLKKTPQRVLHLWNIADPGNPASEPGTIDTMQDLGFYSLLNIAAAAGSQDITGEIQLLVVTVGLQKVTGEEPIQPGKATILGALATIPREYPNFYCRSIDILAPTREGSVEDKEVKHLLVELFMENCNHFDIFAWRGNHRWVQRLKPHRMKRSDDQKPLLRDSGVYLVTGGLGGMGLTVAHYLAVDFRARLILLGRSPFPSEEAWDQWLASHGDDDPVSYKIRKLQECQKSGAEIMVASGDVANAEELQEVIRRAKKRFGTIDGVIHAAGVADYEGVIQERNREKTDPIMAPKVKGTMELARLLKDVELDFFVLCSSLSSTLGPFGQVGYSAANAFLDAFALSKADGPGGHVVSINWGAWQHGGMAVEAVKHAGKNPETALKNELLPSEGIDALLCILEHRLPRVAVFKRDLVALTEQMNGSGDDAWITAGEIIGEESPPRPASTRPELSVSYAPPRDTMEQALVDIWEPLFGIRQLGIYDDFFELGGDSLKAAALVRAIHKEMNIRIPLAQLFKTPVICELARYIKKAVESKFVSINISEKKEYYPLSSAQKRLYILQQMDKEGTGYNMPLTVVMEGKTGKEIQEKTFTALIDRHESLRTSFVMINREPKQKVHQKVEFKINVYDLEMTQKGCTPQHVDIIKDFARPFDLSRPPLIRVGVIQLEEDKHILMVDMHHIISDGISHNILVRDFTALYTGDRPSPLKLQYKDYSEWQNSPGGKEKIKQQEHCWLNWFSDQLPVLKIPIDYPRPETRSFEGQTFHFRIEKEQTGGLKKRVQEEGVTLQMLMVAIFHILLSKLSGLADVITGTTTAGRSHADLEGIIGIFVNTLALRNFPSPGKTFRDFLKEVKENSLKAYENQDYPFEDLVKQVKANRDYSRNPVFDILFEIQAVDRHVKTGDEPEIELPGVRIRPYEGEITTTKFDMDWVGVDTGDDISFTVTYCSKLFKEDSVRFMAERFVALIDSVLNNTPLCKLNELEYSTAVEKELSRVPDVTFHL
jgi:acyl transferase domain-containing protein/acyl carrier protein